MSQRNPYQQTSGTKKKQHNQQDGSPGTGALGSVTKRTMYIGGTLLLFFALVWWIPLNGYYNASDFCNYRCENYATVQTESVTMTLEGAGADGSDVTVAASIAGCYQSTEPATCKSACEQSCDVCESSVASCEAYEEQLFEMFYGVDIEGRATASLLLVLGIAISFGAVLIGSISVIKCDESGARWIALLLAISAILAIIGAIMIAAQFGDDMAPGFEDMFNAHQSLVFTERVWPCVVAITLAVDWYNSALNDADKRMKAWTIPLFIASLTGGICMTLVINYEPDGLDEVDWEYPESLYNAGACVAAGYYIMAAMALARIAVWGGYVQMQGNKHKFGIALVLVIGGVICACGYWAFVAAMWDCEDLVDLDGTLTTECEGFIAMVYTYADGPAMIQHVAGEGIPWEGKSKCYYVGYTFFVLLMSAINAYDMDIVANYRSVKG